MGGRKVGGHAVERLGVIRGIKFVINWTDHLPPHVHATYGGDEATYLIRSGKRDRGSLPKQQDAQASRWVSDNRSMLLQKWDEIDPTKKHKPIDTKKKGGWFS